MEYEKLLKDYTDYLESKNYTENSISTARYTVVPFIKYMRDNLKIGEVREIGRITKLDIENFRKGLAGVSAGTIKNYFKAARHFIRILSVKYGIDCKALEKRKRPDILEGFPEEFKKYFREYVQKKSFEDCPKNTLKKLKQSLCKFYHYLVDRKIEKLRDLRKEDVRDYAPYLGEKTDKKGEKLYQASSINRYTNDLPDFLRWLHKKGVCAPLSSYFVNIRMEQRLSRNILTKKEIVKLFNVKAESPYEFMAKTVCVMLYGSGLRLNELLGLKKESVDFEKKEAYVYESKTRRERIVQLGEVGTEYLKIYLEHIRKLSVKRHPEEKLIFIPPQENTKVNEAGINRNLKKFCLKADIKKRITCHCFRHSFGSHLLENGAKLKQVSDLLGHSDIATTEKYVRLNPEQLRLTILKYHPREHNTAAQS